ncbi:MAG: hypothetical protein K8F25_16240 [Fimbriimonadaceae bacterium]|nr:hypothetical protein [Alphaproteobacteria bacterium]
MRMIVDSNYMQDESLREYLSMRNSNIAVLTDYSAIEPYKDPTLRAMHLSMQILSDFPKQVIVLKSTQKLCRLSGRSAGLVRRMICEEQTRGFPEFCRGLQLAEKGQKGHRKKLLEYHKAATAILDGIFADAGSLLDNLLAVSNEFNGNEIQSISRLQHPNAAVANKIFDLVNDFYHQSLEKFPGGIRKPRPEEVHNTFLFRHSLCAIVFLLQWIREGRQLQTKTDKLVNDLVDMQFAITATYFDGILSNDKRLLRLYVELKSALTSIAHR